MQTLALYSQKGGSGKTTLTIHLAVAAQDAGKRVAVIDLDPQCSAVAWQRTRKSKTPFVVAIPDSELVRALDGAKSDGFDLVFIDCPPHAAPVAARIIAAANMVLIPVRPSPMDIAALPATVQLIGNKSAAFVLSACPHRAPEIEETRTILGNYGKPVFGPITDRRQFFRAVTAGQAVSEFEPDGQAAVEIEELFKNVMETL